MEIAEYFCRRRHAEENIRGRQLKKRKEKIR